MSEENSMMDCCDVPIEKRYGKIGVYGEKTRKLQYKLTCEAFGLTFKKAMVYMFLGDKNKLAPDLSDSGNTTFNEYPDRAYNQTPVEVPIAMESMMEAKADFSRFGIIDPLGDENTFRMFIGDFKYLGRELIVGDVLELPFFEKNGKKAFWEVTDVDLKTEYEKFTVVISGNPLGDSRTTRDIPIDQSNVDVLDGMMDDFDDDAIEQVPVDGFTFEENPVPEDVDYRNENQKSFLDDPDQEF